MVLRPACDACEVSQPDGIIEKQEQDTVCGRTERHCTQKQQPAQCGHQVTLMKDLPSLFHDRTWVGEPREVLESNCDRANR